ncbi:MAG: hypothetical protein KKH75_09780 [Actinobacteria bacterium]|nr:hypothetical protein [Actinomycetota bacterium]
MQILLAFLFAAAAGALVHFTVPGRETRGVALTPIVAAFVGGLVWMIFTWFGVGIDSPWIWIASIAVPFAVAYPAVAVLTRVRHAHDARERTRLRIA